MRASAGLAATALSAVLTLTLQGWVGPATIYADRLAERRLLLHRAVADNEAPPEGWRRAGANRINTRVAMPWVAERIHHATGLPVLRVYRIVDSAALFGTFLLLFVLLGRFGTAELALAGVLFAGAVLPLTYFNHYFHPWDRPSALLWLALMLTVDGPAWRFGLLAVLAVLVKYDAVIVPAMYYLVHAGVRPRMRTVAATLLLSLATIGTLALLLYLRPDGGEQTSLVQQVRRNVWVAQDLGLRYPPLLMFGLPVVLAAIGWRASPPIARAWVQTAALVAIPLILLTNFVEVRAEVPILFLLLPAALHGVRACLSGPLPTRLPAGP